VYVNIYDNEAETVLKHFRVVSAVFLFISVCISTKTLFHFICADSSNGLIM